MEIGKIFKHRGDMKEREENIGDRGKQGMIAIKNPSGHVGKRGAFG